MQRLTDWLLKLADARNAVKQKNLDWQTASRAQQAELKQARILAEQTLADELKKQSLRLEHEISLLKTRQDTELAMYQARCKQDLKDYQRYLDALDRLKTSIQTSYAHLPESVALTIHHHAKHLLHAMWEAEDYEQKIAHELRLIQFMTTVHEDAQQRLEDAEAPALPVHTLDLIKRDPL